MVTHERVRELLDYDPETGAFVWKVKKRHIQAGTVAGFFNNYGYRQIGIDGSYCGDSTRGIR